MMNHAWLDLLLLICMLLSLNIIHPFLLSLDNYIGSCNVFSPICIPKETKGINFKAFNIITNGNEAKERTYFM